MAAETEDSLRLEIGHVLFVDIVGYSRLLIDEQKERLQRLTHIVLATQEVRDATGEHLITLPTGDGMALVFRNHLEAPVRCAIEIAQALRSHPEIPVRMGIHSGPVSEVKDINARTNIAGPGINLAQRVMDCGDSGHILLSQRVADDLAQYRQWAPHLHDLGDCTVKHGVRIRIFNLHAETFGNAENPAKLRQEERQPSIAVLPFANLSADKENEYFGDGLAEEILNLLAKIDGLKVIARTSSFAFRGKEEDIRKIADALRVQHILEGSVRKSGARVRVTAQLIHAADGAHLWSERYDRDLTDVFAIQDEIGQAISEALKVRLAPRTRAVNIEAWQHWMKGVHHRAQNTPDGVLKAKEHFEQAAAIDPNYAQAYSGLALAYYVLALMGMGPIAEMKRQAIAAAEKALAIDTSDSESYTVLAVLADIFDHDWTSAENHHVKSVSVDNVSPRARFCYSNYFLLPQRRIDEAIEQNQLALRTDPLSMLFQAGMVWCLFSARQYDKALACAKRALEIDSNFHLLQHNLGLVQLAAGLPQDAIRSFSRLTEIAPWHHMGPGCLAAAWHRAGDHARSGELARQFPRLTFGTAIYHAIAGEIDGVFQSLESAYEQRDIYLLAIDGVPWFEPYRNDPRFQSLLQRMNLG